MSEERDLGFLIVEKMGHTVAAGHGWDVEFLGERSLRLDSLDSPHTSQHIAKSAIFTVTLCTEEDARAARAAHPLAMLGVLPRKPCRRVDESVRCQHGRFDHCGYDNCRDVCGACDSDIPF